LREDRDPREKGGWRLLATALVSGIVGMVITGMTAVWTRVEKLAEQLHLLEVKQASHEAKGDAEDQELKRRVDRLEQKK
jgi:hypothetical protein